MKALLQCRGEARLAEAGFAGDQHDLTVARLGALPAPQQQAYLLVAADQPGQCRAAQGLEPAHDDALSQHLPNAHTLGAAGRVDRAEITAVEQVADQVPSRRLDCHDVRLRP